MISKIREYLRSLRREDAHVMLIVSLAIAIVVGLAGSIQANASTFAPENDLPSGQSISSPTLPTTNGLPSSNTFVDEGKYFAFPDGFDDDFGDEELGIVKAPVADASVILIVLACLYGLLCRKKCRTNTDN